MRRSAVCTISRPRYLPRMRNFSALPDADDCLVTSNRATSQAMITGNQAPGRWCVGDGHVFVGNQRQLPGTRNLAGYTDADKVRVFAIVRDPLLELCFVGAFDQNDCRFANHARDASGGQSVRGRGRQRDLPLTC